ncbi:MAG: hypothetical protein JJT95_19150 [Pararhodobacter sp.]|nr:hypothetical protein [Pararhodobacter sp.]
MSWGQAIGATWKQAALFAVVFLLIGMVLDVAFERSVGLEQRATTILLATGVYWVLTAWLLKRRQG